MRNAIRIRMKKHIKTLNDKVYMFSLFTLLITAIFFVFKIISHGNAISSYFVPDNHDTFMDYFNMLYNVSFDDPYLFNANYPAMPFLIWKILFRLIPVGTQITSGYMLREFLPAQLVFLFVLYFVQLHYGNYLKKRSMA